MNRWIVDGVADALICPEDRGLLYGDGLFETIAFHRGRSRLWPLHMQRLERGCERLGLPAPDPAVLAAEARELLAGRERAVIRIALTRGVGGTAYFPPDPVRPTRIVLLREWPPTIERRRVEGLRMRSSPIRLGHDPAGGLKHMNRLDQVLIADRLAAEGADEALVVDPDGWLVEGLSGNLVIERDGGMIAPGPHPSAVAGVGLAWLRRRAGDRLIERAMQADEVAAGDRLWVINSIQGPCPVRELDGRRLEIEGVVRHWQDAWREEVES